METEKSFYTSFLDWEIEQIFKSKTYDEMTDNMTAVLEACCVLAGRGLITRAEALTYIQQLDQISDILLAYTAKEEMKNVPD